MRSFGTLPVARLRVIGAMTRRSCSASGPREVCENRSDMIVCPQKLLGSYGRGHSAARACCRPLKNVDYGELNIVYVSSRSPKLSLPHRAPPLRLGSWLARSASNDRFLID